MPIERKSGKQLEWFPSLEDVPGVEWRPPEVVVARPPLLGSRPILRVYAEGGDEFVLVTWVAEDGSERTNLGSSPAEDSASTLYEAEHINVIAETISTALSLPGTKYDYFNVIESGIHASLRVGSGSALFSIVEHLSQIAIKLIGTGVRDTVVRPFPLDDQEHNLQRAASPYLTLMDLYRSEGFLREAAQVFDALQELPELAQKQVHFVTDPRETIDGLEDLTTALPWPE